MPAAGQNIHITKMPDNTLTYPLITISRLRIGLDGVGVTSLIAGAGCPLRCRWCLNKKLLQEAPSKPVTAEQMIDMVKIDDLYYRATGGGITFGGGESLLHADFILRFRELCPAEWNISAETSLAVPEKNVRTALKAVNDFIVDCKDLDPVTYRNYTGGDPELMRENLQILLDEAGPERVLVRVPLIPEYNTQADQQHSAGLLKQMGFTRLDLFPYVVR